MTSIAFPAAAVPLDVTGWWWNVEEPGRGFSMERQNNTLFFASYVYDATGTNAVWYLSTGQMTTDTRYQGTVYIYSNGQSLAGAYKAPVRQAAGSMTIDFLDGGSATMTWAGGTTKITRYALSASGLTSARNAFQPETGWYYDPAGGGSGYFLEIQGSSMFLAGFMYTEAGAPVWYVSSGTTTNGSVYEGDLDQFGNGQALGGAYKEPQTRTTVGRINVTFSSTTDAVLTVLGSGRRIALERYIFETLPPAPGTANDQTLAGIDSDRDGIRDDLQILIAQMVPKSTINRDSLREVAAALQAFAKQPYSSQGSATSARIEIAQACLHVLSPQTDLKATSQLIVQTFNTTARSQLYFNYLDYAGLAAQAPNPTLTNLTECSFVQGRARLYDFGYSAITGTPDTRTVQPGRTLEVLRQERLTEAAAPLIADGSRRGRAFDAMSGRAGTRPPTDVCEQGLTVFHVNGVGTTSEGAQRNKSMLEALLISNGIAGSDWRVDHLLNETSGLVVYDLWVAFQQSFPGATFTQFLEILLNIRPLVSSNAQLAFASLAAKILIKSTNYLISSRTSAFVQRVKNEVALGRTVILAPHSQGNFYANAIYRNSSLTAAERMAVGIVAVANPDMNVAVDGPSFTRDDDWVMAAARVSIGAEPATIAAANLIPPTDLGFLNHEYVSSYLSQGGAREPILAKFPTVKSRLQAQSPNQTARVIQQESGGQGTTKREFSLGKTAGMFKVSYEMYSIPDRLDVIYRGATVASTGGLVSGSATLTFNYQPVGNDTTVSIVVTAPNSGTAWDYTAYCPSSS